MSIQAASYVGAALIAASAAFVGLVLGKEQKTTGAVEKCAAGARYV